MAAVTAYHLPSPDHRSSTLSPAAPYARDLLGNELDFRDPTRYPAIRPSSADRRASTSPSPSHIPVRVDEEGSRRMNSDPLMMEARSAAEAEDSTEAGGRVPASNGVFLQQDQRQILPSRLEAVVQYALPQDGSRRVIERYGNDERAGLSSAFDEPVIPESPQEESAPATWRQEGVERSTSIERPIPVISASSPRHLSLTPGAGVGAGPSNRDSYSPIIPSSAGPYTPLPPAILSIPVSSKPRAYAQQPTYASAPIPVNPIYMPSPPPPPPPQEEVCVECAMRDQDMADVDVTGPGVWERESDAAYEELCRREIDEGTSEMMSNESHRSRRPRAKGGRLTEAHIKLWLTMNPKEPQARQQTLQAYLKEQRGYLDAETIAHARAMQESRQLDTRMRDTYSQLRRSAYELSSGTPPDETGAMRIMAPRSPPGTVGAGAHPAAHPREVTLLENGMIVEHVDVRKEEREERERRRRDDKRERSRARKTSRGSMYSVRSLAAPTTDNGLAPRPVLQRPTSSMTTYERPTFPRAYSQASISDVHSLGSGSPRQRFFGFKNLSSGFRSRDSLAPSGMSGSMVDMHVALQREAYDQKHAPIDLASKAPSLRHSEAWPNAEPNTPQMQLQEVPKKKKKGFAKIWGIVTGSKDKGASQSREMNATPSFDRTEDDLPLAPPPPLSYLVERGPRDHNAAARQSTVSLASVVSPPNIAPLAISPATSPSSALPSPSSSRTPNMEPEIAGEGRRLNWGTEDSERMDMGNDASKRLAPPRVLHPVTSEPDIRRAQLEPLRSPANYMQLNTPQQSRPNSRPSSVFLLDKSLPPLPGEPMPPLEARPHTMYTYDHRQIPAGASPPIENLAAPRAPFRDVDARRQSFGGTTTRPNFVSSQTLPPNGNYSREARPPASKYEEFGISRRSLANMENMQEKRPASSPTPTKRKSRFGLSSLLGRKSQMYETDAPSGTLTSEFSPRRSASDPRDEVGSNGGYTTSASRHSVGPRMSVMSRKAIEELVEQDPQFVAYRYPSNDQRLDLLR